MDIISKNLARSKKMNTVYVTKSTLFKISGLLDIPYEKSNNAHKAIVKIIEEHTKEKILSKPELQSMASIIAINEILNSETPFTIKIKKQAELDREEKKLRMVYYKQKMTYHHYDNCPNLSSDYENFSIPNEIPENKIDEYRKFFLSNKSLFYKNEQAFYAAAGLFFKIPLTRSVKMHYSNSGKNLVSSNDLLSSNSSDRCSLYLGKALAFYQENKRPIIKYGQASHLVDDLFRNGKISQQDHALISEWNALKSNIKSEIIRILTGINKISDQRFSEEILIALGFDECNTCKSLKMKD